MANHLSIKKIIRIIVEVNILTIAKAEKAEDGFSTKTSRSHRGVYVELFIDTESAVIQILFFVRRIEHQIMKHLEWSMRHWKTMKHRQRWIIFCKRVKNVGKREMMLWSHWAHGVIQTSSTVGSICYTLNGVAGQSFQKLNPDHMTHTVYSTAPT